jgi:hypothetical protein
MKITGKWSEVRRIADAIDGFGDWDVAIEFAEQDARTSEPAARVDVEAPFVCYSFETGWNRDKYFGENPKISDNYLTQAKSEFEKAYPDLELLEIHGAASQNKTEPTEELGPNCLCRIKWCNKKTGEAMTGPWVFTYTHDSSAFCTRVCAAFSAACVRYGTLYSCTRSALLAL